MISDALSIGPDGVCDRDVLSTSFLLESQEDGQISPEELDDFKLQPSTVEKKRRQPKDKKRKHADSSSKQSSSVDIGIVCKDCHHCHEYKRLLAESLPKEPLDLVENVVEPKLKKPAHPKALRILKLWRDVCKEVSGKNSVLPKESAEYIEAKKIFKERYTVESADLPAEVVNEL